MTRADIGEVTPVHGGNSRHGQALAERDHRGIRAAQPTIRITPHQLGHTAQVGVDQLGELEAVGGSDADAVEERGFGGRAKKLIDHVAGLGKNRGQDNQPVIAPSEPIPAPGVMDITTIRQRNQHVRIDNDHKPRTLPAEPLRQQLIDPFR